MFDKVLAQLQLMLLSSKKMLSLAENEDWDGLIAEDLHRSQLQAALEALCWPEAGWSLDQRMRCRQILEQILTCNVEIERHAGEWHDELRSILAQARISTRVSSAYADNSGS